MAKRGIAHIENLTLSEIFGFINTSSEYVVSEKIDGSNIRFGKDELGFYTAREQFGGQRYYNVDDYPVTFATTYQRFAHAALQATHIDDELEINDEVECEVLFSTLPNVVEYDNVNRIVLLRITSGCVDFNRLLGTLKGVTVTLPAPFTSNGRDINTVTCTHQFKFNKVNTKPVEFSPTAQLMLNTVHGMLRASHENVNMTMLELFDTPLNKRPLQYTVEEWRKIKQVIKAERPNRDLIIANIKQIFIDEVLTPYKSQFGAKWIEGLVLRHVTTGEQIKIVDKTLFLEQKNIVWSERERISKRTPSINDTSIFHNMLVKMGEHLGDKRLGTTTAKRALKDIEINNVNICKLRDEWKRIIDGALTQLDALRQSYIANNHDHCEIARRTLQVYATMYQTMNRLLDQLGSIDAPMQALITLMNPYGIEI